MIAYGTYLMNLMNGFDFSMGVIYIAIVNNLLWNTKFPLNTNQKVKELGFV